MTIMLLAVSLLYAFFTIVLWVTWLRIPSLKSASGLAAAPRITVIIPVRNEAENILPLLDDLKAQTYTNFDVIVADDSSTDDTLRIVQAYARTVPFLRVLPLADERSQSPKKRAITQSITVASGDLIVTTDGDCRVGSHWLASIAGFYQQTGAKLISGPVTFTAERSIFDYLQTVEFSSLIGSGACTMALGSPTMCNGANLCYEKKVFTEVGGFTGVDHIASGDDEFLLHKIADRYPGGVQFLKYAESIVQTKPHSSLKSFYYQRKRWASKWRTYQSWVPMILAVFIFLSNAAPVVAVAGWLLNFLDGSTAIFVVVLKAIPEFLFLRQVLVFLQKNRSVAFIPLTQLVYPFYVVFFGLAAQGKGYQWKGRRLN